MDVIPVMDLLGGLVVQAERGERAGYKPVRSVLVPDADPLSVSAALAEATGCRSMYVADLDAIQGGPGHWDCLAALCRDRSRAVWLDAGVAGPADARRVLACGVGRVVVGTETIADWQALETVLNAVSPRRALPSLDVRGGRVLSRAPELSGVDPMRALDRLAALGLDRLILLTLDCVGTGRGPDWPLLRAARERHPGVGVIAGGGVRSLDDLRVAKDLGLDGVLVATALHRGWIRGADLAAL